MMNFFVLTKYTTTAQKCQGYRVVFKIFCALFGAKSFRIKKLKHTPLCNNMHPQKTDAFEGAQFYEK